MGVQYSYDDVGHLCEVAATAAPNCGSSTGLYLTLPSSNYDAGSRPLNATYGNGVVVTASYTPQTGELASLSYAKNSSTLLGLNYYYQQNATYCPTGNAAGNNGQIQCIADVSSGTGDLGRSVAYTYDQLGRLLTANTTGATQYPAWGLSWTYDRYGNRTAQTVTAGSGYTSLLTINPANNQVTSPAYTYDAAGNVTAEPAPGAATYVYDAEECNTGYTGNGTATYTCDGNELRVKKIVTGGTNAVTTVYVRSGGQVIAEYDNGAAVTAPTREYIYANNLLATITGSTGGSGGTIVYQQRDHLSPRLYTDVNGNDVGEQGTYPFGESWYNNNTTSNWVYTSYERDTESGNDYALARSYASMSGGRFLSPDPLEGIVGDPQSWNRYAYVENDPINLTDPSGQGFWSSLFGAIVNLFGILTGGDLFGGAGFGDPQQQGPGQVGCDSPACIEKVNVIFLPGSGGEGGTGWGMGAPGSGTGWGVGGTGGNGQGGGSASGGSAPQSSGGPGAGTAQDAGESGRGPSGGGATTTASGPSPTPGGGTISNPSGGSIWDECGVRCYGAISWAGNFSAGAGEFLSAGLTSWVNRKTGAASVVDTNSGAYRAGFWTGAGLTVATSAVGSVTAQAVNGGREGIIYGRGSNALLNSGKLRFGWGWKGTATEGYDIIRVGIGESKAWWHSWTIWRP